MYEGIRVMASFIFYQVPSWEKSASNKREIFNSPISELIPNTLKDMDKLKGKTQLSLTSSSSNDPFMSSKTTA